MSHNEYIEWRGESEQILCEFGCDKICRDPPIIQKRINKIVLTKINIDPSIISLSYGKFSS